MNKTLAVLKSLSDETRLRIINLLFDGKELCVCEIMKILNISQTKASRHLSYLKNSGLVTDRKHAQWTYYTIVINEESKFINSLVQDSLRELEVFNNDLIVLNQNRNHKDSSDKGDFSCYV